LAQVVLARALTVALATASAWAWWLSASIVVGAFSLLPRRGRPWWVAAIAALSTGLLTAAVAVAGGAGTLTAAIAGAALAAHLTAIVPLVRAQLRSDPRWSSLALELHVVALLGATAMWAVDFVAIGIPVVFILGLARTVCLLDKQLLVTPSPARIGTREMAWLLVVAAGVHLGLRNTAC
jgi:hypothetical protein